MPRNVEPPSSVDGYNSEFSGYNSDVHNQGFSSSTSSIGGNTPSTPGQGQTDDVEDEEAWGAPTNPGTFSGLLLRLKSDPSVHLELVNSIMDQRRMHSVRYLSNGDVKIMHESMLDIFEAGKDDRVVVLKGEEDVGKRGVVKNKEEEDCVVGIDDGGSAVIIVTEDKLGKLNS